MMINLLTIYVFGIQIIKKILNDTNQLLKGKWIIQYVVWYIFIIIVVTILCIFQLFILIDVTS